jgi:tRNA threonylcarbamoyladenosine modification (KEOPS) complex  Pcc1 subunit
VKAELIQRLIDYENRMNPSFSSSSAELGSDELRLKMSIDEQEDEEDEHQLPVEMSRNENEIEVSIRDENSSSFAGQKRRSSFLDLVSDYQDVSSVSQIGKNEMSSSRLPLSELTNNQKTSDHNSESNQKTVTIELEGEENSFLNSSTAGSNKKRRLLNRAVNNIQFYENDF